MLKQPFATLGVLILLSGQLLAEEKLVATREELIAASRGAQPGTVIRLAGGKYRGGIELRGIRGTRQDPVRIVAADPQDPPVIEGGGSGLFLRQCSYLEISGLRLTGATGNGINADEGGPGQPASRGIVLRQLVVTDVGPEGNRDGIKLSGIDDFLVEGCRVERWGTGGSGIDMVGCHDGMIRGCVFRRDIADRAGAAQANGVQMKGGSARVTVQRCRFENAGGRGVNLGGSTGLDYFRPANANYEARDLVVEDCEFLGGMTPVAFVGVQGARVSFNTIFHPKRWGLRILQENTSARFIPCGDNTFDHNLIVFGSNEMVEAVNVGPATSPDTFHFAANAWYCDDRPDQSQRRVRLPVAESGGKYGIDPRFTDASTGQLTLRPDSPLQGFGVRARP